MSLIYDGANGIFTQIGKLIKHYDLIKADAVDLDADRQDILDAFQASDQNVAIDGLVSLIERWKAEYSLRRAELAGFVVARLRDKATVLDELHVASADARDILARLVEAMAVDGESVPASTVSIGAVSADSDNVGGGKIFTTDILLKTELCSPSQRFTFQVMADSFHDGLEEGSEEIAWEGSLAGEAHGIGAEGSGAIQIIQPVHAMTGAHLTNADFEDFTDNLPDGWSLVAGAAGTNVLPATSGHAAHGANALLLQGDATATAIEIAQSIPRSNVVGRRRYCVSVKLKQASATAGTLTIQFEGSGYAAESTEKISLAVSSLNAEYQLHHFFVTMPALIPDDFQLVIRWNDGTPGSTEKIYVDDIGMGSVNYGGGIGVVAVRDTAPFVRSDRYTSLVTNAEGVFQAFFRRAFGVQLPSHASMPTIADSLAQ